VAKLLLLFHLVVVDLFLLLKITDIFMTLLHLLQLQSINFWQFACRY